MAADKTAVPKEHKRVSVPPAAVVVGLLLALGAGIFYYLDRASKRPPQPPPPLTGAARAYTRSLKLSDVQMNAHESYLKQSVVELTGNIGNTGDRVLRTVEINCVFYDPYGQVVLRDRVAIVGAKLGGLAPGETKPFRLAFDSIPESWNQAMPQMIIAAIDFE